MVAAVGCFLLAVDIEHSNVSPDITLSALPAVLELHIGGRYGLEAGQGSRDDELVLCWSSPHIQPQHVVGWVPEDGLPLLESLLVPNLESSGQGVVPHPDAGRLDGLPVSCGEPDVLDCHFGTGVVRRSRSRLRPRQAVSSWDRVRPVENSLVFHQFHLRGPVELAGQHGVHHVVVAAGVVHCDDARAVVENPHCLGLSGLTVEVNQLVLSLLRHGCGPGGSVS